MSLKNIVSLDLALIAEKSSCSLTENFALSSMMWNKAALLEVIYLLEILYKAIMPKFWSMEWTQYSSVCHFQTGHRKTTYPFGFCLFFSQHKANKLIEVQDIPETCLPHRLQSICLPIYLHVLSPFCVACWNLHQTEISWVTMLGE